MTESTKTIRGYDLEEVRRNLRRAIREGDEQRTLWWITEMDQSGQGALCWEDLYEACSADVGLAWSIGPMVLVALRSAYNAGVAKDPRDGRMQILNAGILLARAPKDARVSLATRAFYGARKKLFRVPDYALDQHTKQGRIKGRTRGSRTGRKHWYQQASLLVNRVDVDEVCTGPCEHVEGGCGVELVYHDAYWEAKVDEAMWWKQWPQVKP